MMSIGAACLGAVLFALGVMAGFYFANARKENGSQLRFQEAIKLWQKTNDEIGELTRRNVVGLGSLRERLSQMTSSRANEQLQQSLQTLIDENSQLDQQVRRLQQETSELRHDCPTTKPDQGYDQEVTSSQPASLPVEAVQPDRQQAFSDFLTEMKKQVQAGGATDALLDQVYDRLTQFIPFQRMGYASIDYEMDRVSAVWFRTNRMAKLREGYSAALSESSLRFIAAQNRPRILDDLPAYLRHHPKSFSTRLLVKEGFCSSLTFPVERAGKVMGFFFLTSVQTECFCSEHLAEVRQVVTQLGSLFQAAHTEPAYGERV
jgi:TolA-binding protein